MKPNPRLPSASALALLACGLSLAIPTLSRANVLAYEGFDYASGTNNLSGNNGGYGWAGAWQLINNGSNDVVDGSLTAFAAPAGFDSLSIGNSIFLPNGRRDGRPLDISAAGTFGAKGYLDANGRIGADGKTLYISFLQQPNDTNVFYEFEFHRDNLGDPGRIGGIGNDVGGNNVNLRAPNGTHTPIGAGSVDVNFYVVRIDFKAGLDDVRVYRNPTSATEPADADLAVTAHADMSFTGIATGAFGNSTTVAHDEIRMGETWADAIGTGSAPPSISKPPVATSGYVGGSARFTVAAGGYPPPTYKWFKGSTEIAGETSSTLLLQNLTAASAGDYKVTVASGASSVTSTPVALTVGTTPAGLLAYEGFEYPTALSSLVGQAGGFGWQAPWQGQSGASDDVVAGSLITALAPGGYAALSKGNSAFMPNGRRDGRFIDTSATGKFGTRGYLDENGRVGATGKRLYISFMQQPNGTSYYYEFEFHRDGLDDSNRTAGIGSDNNPATTVNLRAPAGTHTSLGEGSTAVNFYVMRIDFQDGDDDVRVYRNPTSGTEPAAADLDLTAQADMSFNAIALGAYVSGRTVAHDEIRMGESWASVTIGEGTVPAAAPAIVTPPAAVTTYASNTVQFSAVISGSPAPTYQWYVGTTPIAGATTAQLTLPNVATSAAGNYKLTATNASGSVTTTPVALTVTPRPTDLLAYEGFEYPAANDSLPGQNGGFGWSAAWQKIGGNGDNVVASSLVPALAPSGYTSQSKGNSVFLPNSRRDGRPLDLSPGGLLATEGYLDGSSRVGADGKTIYLSFLQQPSTTATFYEMEFHRDDLGDPGRIGGVGNDVAGGNVNFRAPNNVHNAIGAGNTAVNFYIVRIDFKDGNDDVRVYRNPVGGTEPATADLTLPDQADLSFTGFSLGAYGSATVAHDEIRLGKTWASVIGGASNAAAPSIITPPAAVNAYAGATVEFSAVISGTPTPTFKWYRNDTEIAGETASKLTLTNVQAASAGSYKLTATNASGGVTTTPVSLTVVVPPADLLAYEGFEYPAASDSLGGKNGGFGWQAPWQVIAGSGDNVVSDSLIPTGSPAGYTGQSKGNSVFLPNSRRDGRSLNVAPGGRLDIAGLIDGSGRIGADGKTVYLSFMQQPSTTAVFYEMEFHRDDLGDPGRIGGVGNDVAGDNVNFRAPNNVHNAIGAGSTDVNFYIVRIDFKDGNDDVRVYRNPVSTTEPADADLLLPDQADLSFTGLSMGAYGAATVAHDEIRLGLTWASVLGAQAAVDTGYDQWIAGFTFPAGADKTKTGDPDHDGVSNLLEYAFSLNPTVTASGPVVYTGTTLTTPGTPKIAGTAPASFTGVFVRRKDYVTAGLTYTGQFSADLTTWQNSAAVPTTVASNASADVLSLPWPATVPLTAGGNAAPRFFRVKVTSN